MSTLRSPHDNYNILHYGTCKKECVIFDISLLGISSSRHLLASGKLLSCDFTPQWAKLLTRDSLRACLFHSLQTQQTFLQVRYQNHHRRSGRGLPSLILDPGMRSLHASNALAAKDPQARYPFWSVSRTVSRTES